MSIRAAFVAALLTGSASVAFAQSCLPTWAPSTAEPSVGSQIASSTYLANGDLIVVGRFTSIADVPANQIARWDGTTWQPIGTTGTDGFIRHVIPHPTGGFLIIGSFTQVDGITAPGIARWNNGWSGFGASNSNLFAATVAPSGDIYVVRSGNVSRWDGTTWTDLVTSLTGGLFNSPGISTVIALPDNQVLAMGDFSTINGVTTDDVARWTGTQWVAEPIGTITQSTYINGAATAINGDIIAIAQGPGITNGVFKRTAGTWTVLTFPNGNYPRGIVASPLGGVVIFSSRDYSAFVHPPQLPIRQSIHAWNGSWTQLSIDEADFYIGEVTTVSISSNGSLNAFGYMTRLNGQPISFAGRRAPAGPWTPWSSAGTDIDGRVNTLLPLPNGSTFVGGNFSATGDVLTSSRGATWNGTGWTPMPGWTGVSSFTDISASTLSATGDVLVGGFNIGGVYRWTGSAWTRFGGFLSNAASLRTFVQALATLSTGQVVAAGVFVINDTHSKLAISTPTGWMDMGTNLVYPPTALLALPNGQLIAAGEFSQIGGVPANNIARWTGTTWEALGSGLTLNAGQGFINALERLPDGSIIAGGSFTTAGGAPASKIARWDGTTWSPLGAGVDGSVRDLFLDADGSLLVAGEFTSAGGQPASNIARWHNGVWSAISGNIDGSVAAIARDTQGVLMIGGSFTMVNGVRSPYFARLIDPCACDDIDFNNNQVVPEDQDVIDFFNVLAGATCTTCNDIDFNNNDVFPEDQDVIDFLTVVAGGDCP